MNNDLRTVTLKLGEEQHLEVFIAQPHPLNLIRGAIVFVHGHQDDPRIGGRAMAEDGTLTRIANWRSIIAVAISQPGYGGSDGPPDFCGPLTQTGIRKVFGYLEKEYDAIRSATVLYGVSRGAIAAAMVACQEPMLGGVVLVAGTYDLQSVYERTLPGIRANIEAEAGISPEAFAARSALFQAHKIRAKTCIVHGRQDDRAPVDQAIRLAEALKPSTAASLSLFDCGHLVPFPLRRAEELRLYDQVFGRAPKRDESVTSPLAPTENRCDQ